MIMTYIMGLLCELKELISVQIVPGISDSSWHTVPCLCVPIIMRLVLRKLTGLTVKDGRKTESEAQILEPTVSQLCGPCSSPHSGLKATCIPKSLKVH